MTMNFFKKKDKSTNPGTPIEKQPQESQEVRIELPEQADGGINFNLEELVTNERMKHDSRILNSTQLQNDVLVAMRFM